MNCWAAYCELNDTQARRKTRACRKVRCGSGAVLWLGAHISAAAPRCPLPANAVAAAAQSLKVTSGPPSYFSGQLRGIGEGTGGP